MTEAREQLSGPDLIRKVASLPSPILTLLERADGNKVIDPFEVTPEIVEKRKIEAEKLQRELVDSGVTLVKRESAGGGIHETCPHCSEPILIGGISLYKAAHPEDIGLVVDKKGMPSIEIRQPHLRMDIPGNLFHAVTEHGVRNITIGGINQRPNQSTLMKFFYEPLGNLRRTRTINGAIQTRPRGTPRQLQTQLH